MSPWTTLSWISGIVVFFSSLNPVAAAPTNSAPQILTAKVEAALNHPKFACQILWVRIQDDDREEFEMLLSSMSHIDQVGRRESTDVRSDTKYITFKIQSVMWLPGGTDFKNDFHALRELSSLDVVGCQMFTQSPRNK